MDIVKKVLELEDETVRDFNRNPSGVNQFTAKMKSIEEIKNIWSL